MRNGDHVIESKVVEDAVKKPPIVLDKKAAAEARNQLLTGLARAHRMKQGKKCKRRG